MAAITSISPHTSSSSIYHKFNPCLLACNLNSSIESSSSCFATRTVKLSNGRKSSSIYRALRIQNAATKQAKTPGICYISIVIFVQRIDLFLFFGDGRCIYFVSWFLFDESAEEEWKIKRQVLLEKKVKQFMCICDLCKPNNAWVWEIEVHNPRTQPERSREQKKNNKETKMKMNVRPKWKGINYLEFMESYLHKSINTRNYDSRKKLYSTN